MLKRHFLFFCLSCLLLACSDTSQETDPIPDTVQVDWSLFRADSALVFAQNPDQLLDYLQAHPRFARQGMGLGLHPEGDGPLIRSLFRLAQDPKIDSLHQLCQDEYGQDLPRLRQDLHQLFRRMRYFFPDFAPPMVYTVVTGLGYDLMLKDSLLIVGLDYYLGSKHFKTPPPDPYGVPLPQYIWQRYSPESIAPHTALFLINRYAQKDLDDRRLLNEMMTWGKILYAAQRLLPQTPPHLLIGYTEQQWTDTEASAANVYRFFVEEQLFFDAGQTAKTKYIQERPFTAELSQRAPGRLGVWLGWKIVQAYMEKNPNLSVQELMQITDAQSIFEEARYRPK